MRPTPHRPIHARASLSHPHTQIGLAIDPPDPALVVRPQPEPVDLAKSVAVWLGVINALIDRIERSPLACFIRRVNQEMNG